MAPLVWLVAGVLFAAAEVLTGDLTLVMLGAAALGTAGVTALLDTSPIASAVVFAALSAVLLLAVRPALRRRYAVPPPLATNVAALQGRTALVLEEVTDQVGRVKLTGEVWSARALNPGDRYEQGSTVYVMEIDGATAVVWKEP